MQLLRVERHAGLGQDARRVAGLAVRHVADAGLVGAARVRQELVAQQLAVALERLLDLAPDHLAHIARERLAIPGGPARMRRERRPDQRPAVEVGGELAVEELDRAANRLGVGEQALLGAVAQVADAVIDGAGDLAVAREQVGAVGRRLHDVLLGQDVELGDRVVAGRDQPLVELAHLDGDPLLELRDQEIEGDLVRPHHRGARQLPGARQEVARPGALGGDGGGGSIVEPVVEAVVAEGRGPDRAGLHHPLPVIAEELAQPLVRDSLDRVGAER